MEARAFKLQRNFRKFQKHTSARTTKNANSRQKPLNKLFSPLLALFPYALHTCNTTIAKDSSKQQEAESHFCDLLPISDKLCKFLSEAKKIKSKASDFCFAIARFFCALPFLISFNIF